MVGTPVMTADLAAAPIELPLLARSANRAEPRIGRTPKPKVASEVVSPGSAAKEKNSKAKSDNAVTAQLTKTKMCCFFERGKCASANCRYAHSETELRCAPNLQKTKLCRAFLGGGCNDENCFYAHGEVDLRVTEGIYKTQICNFFERGYCKKGDRCNHAHGSNDLRPMVPTAMTPCSKTSSTNSGAESSRPRRSPLPLAELLVDSEGSFNTIPPTPTKSVTELASLAFSPMPSSVSSPLWGQYGVPSMSPIGNLGPVSDLCSMWPQPARDPVEMLVDQHVHSANKLLYAMDASEPPQGRLERHLHDLTPEKAMESTFNDPSPLHNPFTASAEPSFSTPAMLGGAPGLSLTPVTSEPPVEVDDGLRDPLMLNLTERLASLDAVVQCLSNDIADIRSDPRKTLHRI